MAVAPGNIGPAGRALRGLGAGVLAALAVAVTIWLDLVWGAGQSLTGQPYALAPAQTITRASLARDALMASAPLVPPLALLAALAGPWPMRALAVALVLGGWYWAGDRIGARFAADQGAAWLPGEAFGALIWQPVLTPALMALTALAYLWLIAVLNRPQTGPRGA